MGIDAKHPQYEANEKRWQRCRDCYDGEDAIKSRGRDYLPKPKGLDADEYRDYASRALFYEAVGRTVDGFKGAISRKPPTITVAAKLQPLVDDATADGLSLPEFSELLCGETILQGRGGVLVDYDEQKKRAKLCFYPAEAITNWTDTSVVLHECVFEPDPEDSHKQVEIEQYRELVLVKGVYTVTLWRKAGPQQVVAGGSEWIVYGPPLTPSVLGKALDRLPFYWLSPQGRTAKVVKPPLLGLVNVCLSHYRNSADLEHGRHFCGCPTLWIAGAAEGAPIHVGALSAIVLSDPAAKVGYAEFSGQGLKSLETALEQKQSMMAVLGAAVFHDGPKGVEAAETARIRTSGETSLLAGVVTTVEETLMDALECAAQWMSAGGSKIEVALNREFTDTTIDGPTLTAMVQAYQAGALTIGQFLWNMQQGEMLSPDTDLTKEAAQVVVEAAARQDAAIKLAQATKPAVKPGA